MLFDPFTVAIHNNSLMNMVLMIVVMNHAILVLYCDTVLL